MVRTILCVCVFMLTVGVWAGDDNADAAVAAARKAVDYLSKQQNENGTFGKSKQAGMPGIVGLVVKALASSPDKLQANSPIVDKAAKYILSKQQASGAVGLPGVPLDNYNTSVAILALKALENPAYQPALEKAKAFILGCQHLEDDPQSGSFGYGSPEKGDVSNSAFSADALKAMGLQENSPAWKNLVKFIKRCQDNDETNDLAAMQGGENTGAFTYAPNDSEFGYLTNKAGKKLPKPYGNMTYQAVRCLILAGVSKDDPALQAAFKWIKNNYSVKANPGGVGSQGYYYYVIAFAKTFTAAGMTELEVTTTEGTQKVNWARDLSAHLVSLQSPDGSFVNTEKRWMEDDPILSTAYALDTLNLCIAALK